MRDNSYITPEFRKRMAAKSSGNKNAAGHTMVWSAEARKKISDNLKGIKRSKETRKKMSLARKGIKFSDEIKKRLSESHLILIYKDWEELNYHQRHSEIRRTYKHDEKCEGCGKKKQGYFDWANISGEFLNKRSDWKFLCRACHGKMDSNNRKEKGFIWGNCSQIKKLNRRVAL